MEGHVVLTHVVGAIPVELESVVIFPDAIVEATDLERHVLYI